MQDLGGGRAGLILLNGSKIPRGYASFLMRVDQFKVLL